MGEKQEQQQEELKKLGSKLETPPSSNQDLLKLLEQAVTILSDLDQSPSFSMLESMQPFLKAIAKPQLLKHQDEDVKILVASCFCEITRITAPEAPYSDNILKDIFGLIVGTLSGLNETNGSSFGRIVNILETLARYRSCVVMLDLECDDLVKELFKTFLAVARDDHPENVLMSMRTIMFVLLDESEDIHPDLLMILLSKFGQNKKDFTEAARKLSMDVIKCCAAKLEPSVKKFLMSSLTEDSSSSCQIDGHEVIYDLYRCSPQILCGVVPYLTGDLLNDQLEARLKAVNLVGKLFSIPGSVITEAFQSVFAEFLKRLTDRVVEVRMTVLDYVRKCLLSNPSRSESAQIFGALCDRLLDYDEHVRKQVVAVVCDVTCSNLSSVPVETIKLIAERLRDKSLLVKKYTLVRLAEIYRLYCLRCKDDGDNEFDWIPGKILRCFFDKDFRSDTIESVLCGPLFPAEFAVKDIVGCWIRFFAGLDKIEVKALEKILEQKQRLQQEMQKYLCLKQTVKDADVTDYKKKVILLFRVMSRFFVDPVKVEEGFLALDQLNDAKIWKILPSLLDPNTSLHQACANQDDLLKTLEEKHSLFDFLRVLSLKVSYMLFSKDHVKEILSELAIQKSAGNTESCLSCVNILVILASYSPLLLIGSEEDLLQLLKDDNEIVKEGILHVLARAGGTIREQLASSSSSVDLILERLCLEGTRRQAKYAVYALATITKDDGLRSLSVLCKRLVDMMEKKAHLPTVLQSLGCIAQTAMAVFETRESEIVEFIMTRILQSSNKGQDKAKPSWSDPSELCMSKIVGLKTLVKSYLPVKDAHLRDGIDRLIEILRNMLLFGEISRDINSSAVDKAHLKLASAKAVLRLSRYWDRKIPVDIFHLALKTVEINYRQVRKLFLSKVHQYIKDHVLDVKYACAFLLDIFGSKHAEVDEDKHNLADIIQMCRQMKARQVSLQSDANSQLPYPECVLPYLVHALAHHPRCPNFDECRDVKAIEPLYRVLYIFLSMVVLGDENTVPEANNSSNEKDTVEAVISILQCIKRSEDVVEHMMSKNSYAISELGLLVVRCLVKKSGDYQGASESISLPPTLYKPSDIKEDDNSEAGDLRTWLADESILAHFESLVLDVNGSVHLEIPQDEVLEDIEKVGNEMPLGKLIKRIKSQKKKSKSVVAVNSSSTELKNDIDILKVVREINLDDIGFSGKVEPSNGHDSLLINKSENGGHQNKKRKVSDAKATPIPKRRRTLSSRSPSRYSLSSASKASIKASFQSPSSRLEENLPSKSNLLEIHKKKRSDRGSKRSDEDKDRSFGKTDISAQKRLKLAESDKSNGPSDDKSSVVSIKKRKSSNLTGLAKCTSKEVDGPTTDLVDCRIKVWWPIDKSFYEGVIKSYDPEKKKHVVLYDDGDVEILCLKKERWELCDDGYKLKKKSNTTKSPFSITSPRKKSKLLKGSGQKGSGQKGSDKRSSSAKEKRTQKKILKSGNKSVQERKNVIAPWEAENKSDIPEPTVSSDANELESGDNQEVLDEMPASLACDVEMKSDTTGQEEEKRFSGTDPVDSGGEADASPESEHDGGAVDSPGNSCNSDMERSLQEKKCTEKPSEPSQRECNKNLKAEGVCELLPHKTDTSWFENVEDADDEPLSIWKQRVGKSHKTK